MNGWCVVMRRRYDDYYSNPLAFILSGFLVLLLEKGIMNFISFIRNRRIEKAKREQIINNYNNQIKAKLINGDAVNEEKALKSFNTNCNFLKTLLIEIDIIEGRDYNESDLKSLSFYDNLIIELNKKLNTELKPDQKQKYKRALNAVKNTKEKYIAVKSNDEKYINIINKLTK